VGDALAVHADAALALHTDARHAGQGARQGQGAARARVVRVDVVHGGAVEEHGLDALFHALGLKAQVPGQGLAQAAPGCDVDAEALAGKRGQGRQSLRICLDEQRPGLRHWTSRIMLAATYVTEGITIKHR